MLAILHGDDVVAAEREYRRLRDETDASGLSTTVLDDPRLTVDDVIQAADALPFFGGQRFVGVRDFLRRLCKTSERGKEALASRDQQIEQLAGYLARLPATTTLVFWDSQPLKLPASLERAARAAGTIQSFAAPSRPAELQPWLETWLQELARARTVTLTRDASQQLAAQAAANVRAAESGEREQRVATELRRLVTDLEKLATYAGEGARIDGKIVRALAPDTRAQVFDLVDAVAARATPRALRLLEQALAEGLEPLAFLRLLDRQISALLKAEAVGGTERAIESEMKAPGWLARKYAQQARGFGGGALRRAHQQVLEADVRIKTGQATGEAAVCDLVLALCLDRGRTAPARSA